MARRSHGAVALPATATLFDVMPKSPEFESGDAGSRIRFIDLFAGIGGMRLGFEEYGDCVFTSEWNRYAQQTYKANFSENEQLVGDIIGYPAHEIPDHEVLLAGFPCQPFSIAGVSKKNALGRPHGFACEAQGTLFFEIAEILRVKQPAAFVLENVKNLAGHDGGRTFTVIRETLQSLGYNIFTKIIDAQSYVPQHRERIFIVGFKTNSEFAWDLRPPTVTPVLADILHREDGSEQLDQKYLNSHGKVLPKYTLSRHLWTYLQAYAEKHRAKGNGFGFGLVGPESVARTLSARYYKDGSEILVSRGKRSIPRRLTPRECARLMGFPDTFVIPVSDTQAYKQFGNSVVVPVVRDIARLVCGSLERSHFKKRTNLASSR